MLKMVFAWKGRKNKSSKLWLDLKSDLILLGLSTIFRSFRSRRTNAFENPKRKFSKQKSKLSFFLLHSIWTLAEREKKVGRRRRREYQIGLGGCKRLTMQNKVTWSFFRQNFEKNFLITRSVTMREKSVILLRFQRKMYETSVLECTAWLKKWKRFYVVKWSSFFVWNLVRT